MLRRKYEGSSVWEADVAAAREKFALVRESHYGPTSVGEASAGTGSRYVVVVHKLAAHSVQPEIVGGQVVVSVMEPWQMCWSMVESGGSLELRYVREHFVPKDRSEVHGGDLVAVAMLIGRLTGRKVI